VSVSRARALLAEAAGERVRSERHLLVAAALREALAHEPVVVGGTAQDMYTGGVYRETDLDLCGWLEAEEEALLLTELGFVREGRHLTHVASKVAVEFPESEIHGDRSRVVRKEVRPGALVAIIGVEDLYLDRIRQATAPLDPSVDDISAKAALAIAIASFEGIDWAYVVAQIRATEEHDPPLGARMRKVHERIRRKVLRLL
jgi:hypothetical protein